MKTERKPYLVKLKPNCADAYAGKLQVNQTGSTLQLYELGHPEPAEAGTIRADSTISFSGLLSFEEAPREGDRVFS